MKPVFRQYLALKREIPGGAVLLTRIGPHYRSFGPSGENGLSIPVGKIGEGIGRLVSTGLTVALADYAEAPRPGRLVRREITRIFSPA